jgi:ankyrin repeat protein
MKKTTSMILMMVLLHTLHSVTFAQTPQTLKGTWVVDIKATEELLKSSPPPPQDLQWISLSSGLMFQMIYEFTDSAIAMSAYTSEKKIMYQLLPGQDNTLRYVSTIKQAGRDDIWIVNTISDAHISISSSQSPATKYFLLKRVKLDPNMRAEDGKRAFEAWKVWVQAIAPFLAPKGKVEQPKSALWEAISNRDVEKAKALISSGADVNYASQQGTSILHQALFLRNAELIELLIARGANVDAQNNQGETPLHWAASGGIGAKDDEAMLKMAEVLIAHKADINKMSSTYGTPLNKAAYYNKIQMAKLLIAHGADVEGKGASPLSSAGGNGDYVEMAQLLVDSGAGVNTRASNGSYPLHAAAFHDKVTTLLLSRGANPNALTEKGFTVLYFSAGSDYGAASAEALLSHGADPNAKITSGRTALHQAAGQGAIKVIEVLLAHKADINAIDNAGYTPLYGAISYGVGKGGIGVVEVLVKNGAKINVKNDRDGETPFHKAISRGNIDVVQLLISHGADVNAVSKYGVTSLYFARNSKAITQLLQEHGAH